jgi:Cu/Ag efflux protein CusF
MTRRVLFLALPLLAAACKKAEPPARHYQMRGVVLKIDSSAKSATIDAEKIEGWMGAMTMDYPVANPADLLRMKPGSKITATVDVRDLDYSISNIQVAK